MLFNESLLCSRLHVVTPHEESGASRGYETQLGVCWKCGCVQCACAVWQDSVTQEESLCPQRQHKGFAIAQLSPSAVLPPSHPTPTPSLLAKSFEK